MRRFVFWLCILFVCFGTLSAQDSDGLYVDAGQVLGEISPYVYGANHGGYSALPTDLYELAAASGITFLRSPGGRWGDENNISHFNLDFWKITADIVGADLSIHVRLENGTPEAAAELVRYANIEKGYNIRYWYIGNEPNLFENYTTEDLNTQWRAIALAMLEIDPEIILVGPDISQWNEDAGISPDDAEGRDWLREFLRANGDLVDVVSVHRYPFPRTMTSTTSIEDLRNDARQWSLILPRLREIIFEETGRTDVLVAVTEANSHWSNASGGDAALDSYYNAIWWADVLGRLIQGQPEIVAFFDFQRGPGGAWGLLERYDVRPTYYTYQLYRQFGETLLFSESADDLVTIYAAQRENGTLTLIVVNLADDEQTRSLTIDNFENVSEVQVWRLDPEHNAEQLDNVDLSSGEVTLPGQSVTLYVLPAN
jgi:hypothetical protein